MTKAERLYEARKRALIISRRIGMRTDETVKSKILSVPENLPGEPEDLGIDADVLNYVESNEISRWLVFAHPMILRRHPDTSLYYRGISTLSLKRVSSIACSVDRWEKSPELARVTEEKAFKVAKLYNIVISSIIRNSTNWTLEDGHRNIIATIGITEDGTIRNIIGQEAENAVKEKVSSWIDNEPRIVSEKHESDPIWYLRDSGDLRMVYSAEPDIRFEKQSAESWEIVSTIEIKGGTDPAGALERLGAVKKSFDQTPTRSKNFLIVGVVTEEMSNQLDQMQIERYFMLTEVLNNSQGWEDFVNEVFHHTLRLLDTPFNTQ